MSTFEHNFCGLPRVRGFWLITHSHWRSYYGVATWRVWHKMVSHHFENLHCKGGCYHQSLTYTDFSLIKTPCLLVRSSRIPNFETVCACFQDFFGVSMFFPHFVSFCHILHEMPMVFPWFSMVFEGFPMYFAHCSVVIVARHDRLVGLQEEGGATQGAADHAQGASATQHVQWRMNGEWVHDNHGYYG